MNSTHKQNYLIWVNRVETIDRYEKIQFDYICKSTIYIHTIWRKRYEGYI